MSQEQEVAQQLLQNDFNQLATKLGLKQYHLEERKRQADKILGEIASIEDDLDTIKERMKLLDDSTPICKKVESLINESKKIKDLAEKTKEAEDVQS